MKAMKPLRILVLVLAGAAVVALAGVGRPEPAGGADKPIGGITVNGTGSVEAVPDEAEFMLGVQTEGATAREALAANSAQTRQVLAALKSAGIEKRDIQTQDVSVSPDYRDENVIDGYTTRNAVRVKIRELGRAGAVLDAAANAGANEVYGPTLSRSNHDELQGKALRDAVENARRKAEALAKAAGVQLGEVTSITEGFAGGGPEPYYGAERLAKADVAIEPGTQDIQATVTVTFAIA
jgi:uncharacterized protein